MEVRYVMAGGDYWAYNQFIVSRAPALRVRSAFAFVFAPLIVLGEMQYFFWGRGGDAYLYSLGVPLAFWVAWIPFTLWLTRRNSLKSIRARPEMLSLTTVAVSPRGLTQTTSLSETHYPWSSFTEISESRTLLCFFISPIRALPLPKRALSEADGRAFLELARGYRDHAVFGKPLPPEPHNEQWPPPPQGLTG